MHKIINQWKTLGSQRNGCILENINIKWILAFKLLEKNGLIFIFLSTDLPTLNLMHGARNISHAQLWIHIFKSSWFKTSKPIITVTESHPVASGWISPEALAALV
jgi:hypothetical protein